MTTQGLDQITGKLQRLVEILTVEKTEMLVLSLLFLCSRIDRLGTYSFWFVCLSVSLSIKILTLAISFYSGKS